ncbi:MAG: rhomboid family intramembrane serine protease [Methanobacteriota archaeon]
MAVCDVCGEEVALPFKCSYCGGTFCAEHRLPENHRCEKAEESKTSVSERHREAPYVPDSEEPSQPMKIRYDIRISGPPGKPRKSGFSLLPRVSMLILAAIFVVFVVQFLAQVALGPNYYSYGDQGTFLYYLAPSLGTVFTRPWTLITSIFAHGSFMHLLLNEMVLFFFGPALEARIGARRFIYLFFGAGILAGVAQLMFIPPYTILLGASGAILGVLGALTILAPRLPVLLFFFIPLPLWVATLGFGVLSAFFAFAAPGGSIAHMAHFVGMVVGLIYGYKLKRDAKRNQGEGMKKLLGSLLRPRA